VQYRNGIFSIRDGTHRYGAYEKLGLKQYWTLIWCDSEEDFKESRSIVDQYEE
jgi:hypothetical protein